MLKEDLALRAGDCSQLRTEGSPGSSWGGIFQASSRWKNVTRLAQGGDSCLPLPGEESLCARPRPCLCGGAGWARNRAALRVPECTRHHTSLLCQEPTGEGPRGRGDGKPPGTRPAEPQCVCTCTTCLGQGPQFYPQAEAGSQSGHVPAQLRVASLAAAAVTQGKCCPHLAG